MLTVGAKKKLYNKMQIIRNLIHSEQLPNNSSTFVGKSARNFNSQNSKPVEFFSPPANSTSLQPELMPVDAVDDQSSSSRPFTSDALSKISHDGSQCIISSSTGYISATTTKNESSASKSVNAVITSSTSFTSLVPTITTSFCVETIPGKQEHSASQLQQITFLLSKERQHCSSEAEAPTNAKYDNVHLVSPAHLSSLESSCSEDYHTPLGSPDAKKTSFYSQGDVNNFNVGNNSVDNVKVIHINGSNEFVKDEHDEDFVFNNGLCKMIDFKNAEKNYEVWSDGNVMNVPAKLLDEHFPKIISQLTSDDKNVLLRPHPSSLIHFSPTLKSKTSDSNKVTASANAEKRIPATFSNKQQITTSSSSSSSSTTTTTWKTFVTSATTPSVLSLPPNHKQEELIDKNPISLTTVTDAFMLQQNQKQQPKQQQQPQQPASTHHQITTCIVSPIKVSHEHTTTSHKNADKNTNVLFSDDNKSINFIGNSNDFNSENDNTGCSFKSIEKNISPRPSSLSLSSSFYSSALCSSSSSSSSCQQADVFHANRNNNAKPHEKERKVVNSTNSSGMFSKGRVLDFYNTNFYGSINFNSMVDPNEIFNDNNNIASIVGSDLEGLEEKNCQVPLSMVPPSSSYSLLSSPSLLSLPSSISHSLHEPHKPVATTTTKLHDMQTDVRYDCERQTSIKCYQCSVPLERNFFTNIQNVCSNNENNNVNVSNNLFIYSVSFLPPACNPPLYYHQIPPHHFNQQSMHQPHVNKQQLQPQQKQNSSQNLFAQPTYPAYYHPVNYQSAQLQQQPLIQQPPQFYQPTQLWQHQNLFPNFPLANNSLCNDTINKNSHLNTTSYKSNNFHNSLDFITSPNIVTHNNNNNSEIKEHQSFNNILMPNLSTNRHFNNGHDVSTNFPEQRNNFQSTVLQNQLFVNQQQNFHLQQPQQHLLDSPTPRFNHLNHHHETTYVEHVNNFQQQLQFCDPALNIIEGMSPAVAGIKILTCSNCGRMGHLAINCSELTIDVELKTESYRLNLFPMDSNANE